MSSRRSLVAVALAVAVAAASGCLADADPTTLAQSPDGATGSGSTVSTFDIVRSGFVYFRLAKDEPPFTQHDGDAPTFCIVVPENTTKMSARFDWDVPQSMVLQFNGPGQREPTAWKQAVTPPIQIELRDPEEGRWFGFSGPGAVGGMTDWSLVLTFEVDGQAGPGDTAYDGEPCY